MHFCLCMSHRISHVLLFTNLLAAIYLRQRLKFHPFDWLIEIYLQTEGPGYSPQNGIAPTNAWFVASVTPLLYG